MDTGCKKEPVTLDDVQSRNGIDVLDSHGIKIPKASLSRTSNVLYYQGVNLKEKNYNIYLSVQEKLRNISSSGRASLLQIDSIDFESCNVIQDSSETIYACLIKESIDSAFYNLIIEDSSGFVYGPYVLEYVMDSAFKVGFSAGNVDMLSFEGKVAKYTLDALFTPFAGGPDSRDCTHEECWKLIFGGYGSGAGSSSGGLSPGSGVFIPPANQTVSGIAQNWCFYTVPAMDETGNWYNVTIIEPCEESPLYPFTGTGDGSSICDAEECLRFFPDLGFPVRDPIEDAGQGNPPNDPFLECQENALDFTADHCGIRTRSKTKGIDLSSFCMDGGGYDGQTAVMAVMGLTTEQLTWLASNQALFNDVVAFLDEKCWEEGALGLLKTTIEVFPEMLEWMITEGIDDDQHVVIKAEDFNSLDEAARVNHIYKWLRLVRRFEKCGIAECCRQMKLDGDFFTNVDYSGSGGAGFTWQSSIETLTGLLIPITIEWTVAWNEQHFTAPPIGPYGTLDPDQFKLVYPKIGSNDPHSLE